MHVHWDRLLIALGCVVTKSKDQLQYCPAQLHSQPTLRVSDGRISTRFTCTHPNCYFKTGDAVRLVAHTRKISTMDAAKLFAPGGELYKTRIDSTESQAEEYNNGISSQDFIRAYVGQCHRVLGGIEGCTVRSRWAELGYAAPNGQLPANFGALIADDLPPELRKLSANAYRDAFAVHTYEYDNKITAITLRSATNPDKQDIVRLYPECIGVYPEPDPAPGAVVFLTLDERSTTSIRTLSASYQKVTLPVFTPLGLPLPPQFDSVQKLYLITHPASLLAAQDALHYLCTQELIENCKRPDVRVIELKYKPDLATVQRLHDPHALTPISLPLVTWIARRIKTVYLEQGLDVVQQLLQQGPDLLKIKDDLLAAVREIGTDEILQAAIVEQCDSPKTKVILTNGNIVYRTPSGFRGAKPGNSISARLSNVVFDVREELLDAEGTLWYKCDLVLPDVAAPVQISLRHQDFEQAARLHNAITKALAAQRISSRVVIYTMAGFNWAEIRDAFKKTIRTVREVETYGADTALDIHLPGLIITDGGRAIEPQERVISIPPEVSRLYSGIDYRTNSPTQLAPIMELWSTQTLEAAALAMGVSHVVYCIIQDLLCKRAGVIPPVQHLCYIDPLPETWQPTCEQLAAIFSGVPRVAHLPGAAGLKYTAFFKQLSRLGSLPWITELPNGSPKFLKSTVLDIPVNLIALGDDEQAAALSDIKNITYMALDRAPEAQPGYLPGRQIEKIRGAIPKLLQTAVSATWDSTVDRWHTELPAHAMYHGLANLFEQFGGDIVRAPVDMLVRARYIPYSTTVLSTFFRGLRELFHLNTDKPELTKTYNKPSADADGSVVYIMDDIVLIDQAVVRTMNRTITKRTPLSISSITKELLDAGNLVDVAPGRYCVDPKRFWAISRFLWETRVTGSMFEAGSTPILKVLKPASTTYKIA